MSAITCDASCVICAEFLAMSIRFNYKKVFKLIKLFYIHLHVYRTRPCIKYASENVDFIIR